MKRVSSANLLEKCPKRVVDGGRNRAKEQTVPSDPIIAVLSTSSRSRFGFRSERRLRYRALDGTRPWLAICASVKSSLGPWYRETRDKQ